MNITNLTPAEKLWGFFGIAFVLAGVSIAGHGYIYGAEASKTKAKLEISEKDITILEKQRIIAELTDAMVALEGKAGKKGGVLFNAEERECLEIALSHEPGDYTDKQLQEVDIYLVASVIINRHNNGEGSICTITKNKKQFSFNRDPVNFPRSIPLIKKDKGKKYAVVQKVIEKMENGLKPKPDLMWYNNPEFSGDKWHTDQVNEGKFCSISIGNHFFYQKKKSKGCPIVNITEF